MIELLSKYLFVWVLSMVKFFLGVLAGLTTGLSYLESVLLTIAGMMTTVVVLSLLGVRYRREVVKQFRSKNHKTFTPHSRKVVRIWRKFGIMGISMLTPIIFTPIGGTLIVLAFGERKNQIFKWMLISAIFWSVVLNGIVFYFGEAVITDFLH
ncbi:MAG: hypothetical protein OHK0038_10080 [Flammeovirgaceae bacterium]